MDLVFRDGGKGVVDEVRGVRGRDLNSKGRLVKGMGRKDLVQVVVDVVRER